VWIGESHPNGLNDERTEEKGRRGVCQENQMENHRTQVVSLPPPSPLNRTLFIAMTLQLPMNLKAADRMSSSRTGARNGILCGTWLRRPLRRKELWDGFVNVGKNLQRIQESCCISDLFLSRAPASAVPHDQL